MITCALKEFICLGGSFLLSPQTFPLCSYFTLTPLILKPILSPGIAYKFNNDNK
jgi:hypothetical protein